MHQFGHWGTVCGISWNFQDAVVVCRQLGYLTALASVMRNEFGGSNDPIWPIRMQCTGYEASLMECAKFYLPCSSTSFVAGAICSSEFKAQ